MYMSSLKKKSTLYSDRRNKLYTHLKKKKTLSINDHILNNITNNPKAVRPNHVMKYCT